jgi:hypothetical protein
MGVTKSWDVETSARSKRWIKRAVELVWVGLLTSAPHAALLAVMI